MKSTKDILLILASISFLIILGAAVYEHVVLIPKWNAAPPSSLTMFQGAYGLEAEHFWIPIHPITLILMIATLIANWRNDRRKTIILVLISYIVVLAITFSYFVPQLLSIIQTPYQETLDLDLLQRGTMWETLSLIRVGFLGVLSFWLLSSLTKPGEKSVTPHGASVPLSYENDALGG